MDPVRDLLDEDDILVSCCKRAHTSIALSVYLLALQK